MKDRPILFSGPMVRALLAGTKTQTRRVVKPQPRTMPDGFLPRLYWPARDTHMTHDGTGRAFFQFEKRGNYDGQHTASGAFYCPYGQPGDRLWVRETWGISLCGSRVSLKPDAWPEGWPVDKLRYAADGHDIGKACIRPSIHMPRWASRITLEITGVRVERLQDISEVDAKAEGIQKYTGYSQEGPETCYHFDPPSDNFIHGHDSAKSAYRDLWEQINGPGSWDANPWVWVVEFRRTENEHQ